MSTLNHCNLNKNRITSIDILRGFALFGILMIHCIERFDLDFQPVIDSPFWEKIDKLTFHSIDFIFGGKSYAIFSLLFGLVFSSKWNPKRVKVQTSGYVFFGDWHCCLH